MASAATIAQRGSAVAVGDRSPKLRCGPFAESAIVSCECDLVVVAKLAGLFSVDIKLGVVHRLNWTRAD
jgi:hypothetical protein